MCIVEIIRYPTYNCISHSQPDASTVKWFAYQALLEDADSDVLILLDCCHSIGSGSDVTKGTKEIIAACGFESEAPGVGHHSFTSSLIEELRCLGNGPTFTAASLHEKVLNRVMRSWDPGYNAERFYCSDENGRLRDKERRKTPIYRSLNGHPRQRSIEIMPLAAKDMNKNLTNTSSREECSPPTKVTISIQFESSQLTNPRDFVQWLRDMPLLAESVDLISVQKSHSTIVILALPVAVWDLLPDHPACSFIGFTTSTNMLFSMQSTPAMTAKAVSAYTSGGASPSKANISTAKLDNLPKHPSSFKPSGSVQLSLAPQTTPETPKQDLETPKSSSIAMLLGRRLSSPFSGNLIPTKRKESHPTTEVSALSSKFGSTTDIITEQDYADPKAPSPNKNPLTSSETSYHADEDTRQHEMVEYWTDEQVQLLLNEQSFLKTEDIHGYTPLHWAATNGNKATARLLLEKGVSIDAMTDDGATPLCCAAKNGHETIVRLLLEEGASIDVDPSSRGTQALHWAAKNGHEAVVRLLLEKGANIDAVDHSGRDRTALHWAVMKGQETVVRLLVERGANIDAMNDNGRTALHWAAENGNETMVRLLLEKKADINARDHNGGMALHLAAMNGHERVTRLLLGNGVDIDARNQDGETALHHAAEYRHEIVARRLLEAGADTDIVDSMGRTALHWATDNGHERMMRLLLERAAYIGKILNWAAREGNEMVVRLLLEFGGNVEAMDEHGGTALHWAAMNGHKAVVQLLLEVGINLETMDAEYGRTALHWAAIKGNEAVVRLLLEIGANVEAMDGEYGRTALHWAAMNGHKTVVQLLLEAWGINIEAVDAECGRTALHWAAMNGHEAVVCLLLENGANVDAMDYDKKTALHRAAMSRQEAVTQLLLDGSDSEVKDQGRRTSLDRATDMKYSRVVQILTRERARQA